MIRFDASGDGLVRTTMPDHDAPYTWMAWCTCLSTSGYQSIMTFTDTLWVEHDRILTLDGTTELFLDSGHGSVAGSTVGVGVRFHLAMVRVNDSRLTMYRNGRLDAAIDHDPVSRDGVIIQMQCGRQAGFDAWNGRVEQMRLWEGYAMSGPEIMREAMSPVAVRTQHLWAEWPMAPGLRRHRDVTRWARDWTAEGTLTDEGVPIVGQRVRRPLAMRRPFALSSHRPMRTLVTGFPRGFRGRRRPEETRRRRIVGRGEPVL